MKMDYRQFGGATLIAVGLRLMIDSATMYGGDAVLGPVGAAVLIFGLVMLGDARWGKK